MMIGDEEKKIRTNPAANGNAVLQKVFGSLDSLAGDCPSPGDGVRSPDPRKMPWKH